MDSVGRYRVIRRLGAGSFATVWLGHDDDLDVPVAIKVLAENWAANDDVRQRFLSEARILRRIRDPRIVAVYDIGTLPDGRPYFVMDFVNGGSLDDLRKVGIPPVRALRLCAEACRALAVLHAHDVIHRDVTPGNLLLNTSPDGRTQVLLADLGVAKSLADLAGATMTAGTPSYMAPEQATGGTLDRRADVYSLTALTYAMLTGRPPFLVRNVADIVHRDPRLAPEPVAARVGGPPNLDAVLASGLALPPERRPPTAHVLADALDQIADQMEAAGAGGSPIAAATTVLTAASAPAPARSSSTPSDGSGPDGSGPDGSGPDGSGPERVSPVPVRPPAATASPAPAAGSSPGRRIAFYLLVAMASLGLFAVSALVTILILQD